MILFYFGARLGTHIVDLGKGTFSETPGGPLNNYNPFSSELGWREEREKKDSNICN